MAKFEEAESRLFHNTFVCRICKSKLKAYNMKVMQGKVACRRCGSKQLRTVRKK
jgi:ribosomal protein L40E